MELIQVHSTCSTQIDVGIAVYVVYSGCIVAAPGALSKCTRISECPINNMRGFSVAGARKRHKNSDNDPVRTRTPWDAKPCASSNSKLNLNDNALILDYTGASQLTVIRSALQVATPAPGQVAARRHVIAAGSIANRNTPTRHVRTKTANWAEV